MKATMEGPKRLRAHSRVPSVKLTAIDMLGEFGEVAESTMGRTLNISEGGMMLELTRPLPLLSEVTLNVAFEKDIIPLSGQIVHLKVNDEGRIEAGIRFTRMDEIAREKLRRNIRH
ncbi:MAG: PilZ domain-containing protein [Nitrospinae bacterium]|nr:PilZ domain-containing protein [Nitrospinota bacterium]